MKSLKLFFLAGIIVFFLWSCSKNNPAPQSGKVVYIYDVDGSKIYLQEVDSLALVVFWSDTDSLKKIEIIQRINPGDKFPRVNNKYRFVVSLDQNNLPDLNSIRKDKAVKCINLSLMDKEGNLRIPDDRVFAEMKKGYDLVAILIDLDISYEKIEKKKYGDNLYMITLTNGKSVAVSDHLYETGHFNWAQPNFWSKIVLDKK